MLTPEQKETVAYAGSYLWSRMGRRESRVVEATTVDRVHAVNFFWKHPDFLLFRVNEKAAGRYAQTTPGALVLVRSYHWEEAVNAETGEPDLDRSDVKVQMLHDGIKWLAPAYIQDEYWISSLVLDRVNEEEYGVSVESPE